MSLPVEYRQAHGGDNKYTSIYDCAKVIAGIVRIVCRIQFRPTLLGIDLSPAKFFMTVDFDNYKRSWFILVIFVAYRNISRLFIKRGIMRVQESFWDYFWLAKYFLQVAGILPVGGSPSVWKSILSQFLVLWPMFYNLYIVIPEINYVLFRSHDLDDLLEAMIIVIAAMAGQFRSIFVALYRQKIVRLLSICGTLWDHAVLEDHGVIAMWSKRAKLFITIYCCAAQCTVILFVLTTIVKQHSSAVNSTVKYYPFHYQEDSIPSPRYEIKYTLQVIVCVLGISFIAASDMTGTLMTLNMCGQLALIRNWLLEISKEEFYTVKGKVDKSLEAVLRKCIRRHQVVMDFCSELEEVVQYIYLIQIVTGMYIMAIAGTRLTEGFKSYRYFGPFLMATMGIFFSCWPADSLSSTSTEVTEAVYAVPWYSFPPREKKAVAIILARSQCPAELTAGKFVVLSLQTFVSIIYSGISFSLVLNSF